MTLFRPQPNPTPRLVFRRARSIAKDLRRDGVTEAHVFRVMEVEAEFHRLGGGS